MIEKAKEILVRNKFSGISDKRNSKNFLQIHVQLHIDTCKHIVLVCMQSINFYQGERIWFSLECREQYIRVFS